MHIQFDKRKVLVTGSTNGIGLATARGFLDAGATVVINGRTQASVDAGLDKLGRPARASGFVGDLSQADAGARLQQMHPDFDIVVNNLGVFGLQDFFDIPDSEWERFFQTNVMSGVRLSRQYAPGMVQRGWGRIVFISSESGLNIPSDMIHYGFTKTAQLAVSRGLAKRLAGTGVTVNAVLPGPTLSDGVTAPGRQARRLRQFRAGVGDDRCRAAGRRRGGGHHRLNGGAGNPLQRRFISRLKSSE